MWKTSLALLIGLSSCHAAMDDTSSMRSSIDDTRVETTRHLEAARGATTIQQMRDEMTNHRDGMTPMMSDMDMMIGSMMSHCSGLGLGTMRGMHDALDGEMTRHLSRMDATVALAPAMAEVERHYSGMMSTMDRMDSAMSHMTCP